MRYFLLQKKHTNGKLFCFSQILDQKSAWYSWKRNSSDHIISSYWLLIPFVLLSTNKGVRISLQFLYIIRGSIQQNSAFKNHLRASLIKMKFAALLLFCCLLQFWILSVSPGILLVDDNPKLFIQTQFLSVYLCDSPVSTYFNNSYFWTFHKCGGLIAS